jgi:hypothetical protein
MRRPPALGRLLGEQLRRRERGRVPAVDEDPAWIIRETGIDPAFQLRSHFLEQVVERSRRLSSEPRHGVADLAGIAIDAGSAVSRERPTSAFTNHSSSPKPGGASRTTSSGAST